MSLESDFSTGAEGSAVFDPKVLWELVRGRWPWLVVALLLGVSIGLAKYFVSPKLYRATTQMQIEPRNLVPVGQDRNPWIEQWTNMKYFPTQYRLLRSRGLAERVIDDLRLDRDPAFAPRRRSEGGPVTADEDERYKAGLANRLIGGLSVNPIEGTELLNLVYVDTDPRRAADLANAFASAFIDWGIESRSETLRQANQILDTQIENLQRDVEALEMQIQQFSREADVNTTDAGPGAVSQRVQSLNQQYSTASANALLKQQSYNELVRMDDEIVAESFGRPSVATLRAEWESKQNEYEIRLQTFKPDHPDMVELRSEVVAARRRYDSEVAVEASKLRSAAEAEWQAAQRLLGRIDRERGLAQEQSLTLNVEVLPLTNMQMELAAKRQRLSELIESQSQADLSASVQSDTRSNVHIIDKALVPRAPFRPSLRQNVALGGGAGLALGMAVVFLFHFLDRTLKSVEELERLLGLPVLAAIPDVSSEGQSYGYRVYYGYGGRRHRDEKKKQKKDGPVDIELLPETKPRLAVSEAYRSLRTALLLSSAEDLKLITITSAEAGEGKSATSANLATVMAHLGKRVLLIDGDLRKARLHRIFKVSNTNGLVNCLARGEEPAGLVQKTGVARLHLLPCGTHPPNPSELLASERMRLLADWARKHYDFVIIDSPPVLVVSDAILPGTLSDGVVLCFRANQIERDAARRCLDQLRQAGVKVLGLVLNRYRPGGSRYYDRKYRSYEAYAEPEADSAA